MVVPTVFDRAHLPNRQNVSRTPDVQRDKLQSTSYAKLLEALREFLLWPPKEIYMVQFLLGRGQHCTVANLRLAAH